jgi:hypothetical protein
MHIPNYFIRVKAFYSMLIINNLPYIWLKLFSKVITGIILNDPQFFLLLFVI